MRRRRFVISLKAYGFQLYHVPGSLGYSASGQTFTLQLRREHLSSIGGNPSCSFS